MGPGNAECQSFLMAGTRKKTARSYGRVKKRRREKMAEFIMLTGDESKGKTSTLHFVHEILVTKGGKITAMKNEGGPKYRDFFDVVEYNNKKIAIFTAGDCFDHVLKAFSNCETNKADFLICACNNVLKNHKRLEKVFENKINNIEKTHSLDLQSMIAANWYDAWKIIEKLEDCLKVDLAKG